MMPRIQRREEQIPYVCEELGWKYHHIGIPTAEKKPGEVYLKEFKIYVSGFDTSPYGIEWMRFEEESRVPGIIKELPHVAFEVENLEKALADKDILIPPNSPSKGIKAAMILHNGAPVEIIEFE